MLILGLATNNRRGTAIISPIEIAAETTKIFIEDANHRNARLGSPKVIYYIIGIWIRKKNVARILKRKWQPTTQIFSFER